MTSQEDEDDWLDGTLHYTSLIDPGTPCISDRDRGGVLASKDDFLGRGKDDLRSTLDLSLEDDGHPPAIGGNLQRTLLMIRK